MENRKRVQWKDWARFLLMTENNGETETYIFIGGGYRDVHGM